MGKKRQPKKKRADRLTNCFFLSKNSGKRRARGKRRREKKKTHDNNICREVEPGEGGGKNPGPELERMKKKRGGNPLWRKNSSWHNADGENKKDPFRMDDGEAGPGTQKREKGRVFLWKVQFVVNKGKKREISGRGKEFKLWGGGKKSCPCEMTMIYASG